MPAPLGRDWSVIIERARELAEAESDRLGVPPTLRRVHYLLVSDRVARAAGYDNTHGAYKYLGAVTAPLRDAGTFPAFTDRTRDVVWPMVSEADPAKVLRDHAKKHRTNRWASQPVGILLVVEKDGLVPLLEDSFGDLGVPITALRGHTSQSHLREVRVAAIWMRLGWMGGGGRKVVVLYGGDYDPSGLDIERDFKRRLRMDVEVQRVALKRDQVIEHNLPVVPAKTTDSRTAAMLLAEGEAVQVELDALDPLVLVELYAEAITELADEDAWWHAIEDESAEADELQEAADWLDDRDTWA